VEIDILEIRRKYIFFKGHADIISRITVLPTKVMSLLGRKIRKRSRRVKVNIQEFWI
jgi:hypothetical protein